MAELDIPLLCYNFMAGTDWVRTRSTSRNAAGAKVTAFDLARADAAVRSGTRPRAGPTRARTGS